MNEYQKSAFDSLESGKTIVWVEERMTGRTSFIFFYADYLVTNKNRDVVIVCNNPKFFKDWYMECHDIPKHRFSNSILNPSSLYKIYYSNGCIVTFMKHTANLRGYMFDADVLIDLPDLKFDDLVLTFNSKVLLR